MDFGEVDILPAEGGEDGAGNLKIRQVHRLNIPVDGFLRTFKAMGQVVQKLEEDATKLKKEGDGKEGSSREDERVDTLPIS